MLNKAEETLEQLDEEITQEPAKLLGRCGRKLQHGTRDIECQHQHTEACSDPCDHQCPQV